MRKSGRGRKLALGLAVAMAMASAEAAAPADLAHERPSDMLAWNASQQQWGFRSLATLFPVHIAKHAPRPSPLRHSRKPLQVQVTVSDRPETLEGFMAAQRISGLLVIKDGEIVLERYGLGRSAKDGWSQFSVAKSVTSLLVGAALEDGSIHSLDDPVTRYIPEMQGSTYDTVTVRNLITMTSGARWTETYSDPTSDVVQIGSWKPEPGVDPIVSYMRTLPRVAAAGQAFHYKSGEADLAGILVARATGMPLAAYLSKKIWIPAGMEQDAAWITNPAGNDRGGCCLSMGLRDSGRLGLMMLNGGKVGRRQILPQTWIAQSTTSQVRTGFGDMGYGFMWWIRSDGEFQANGIFGQTIDVIPAEGLVIVINSAWPQAADHPMAARQQQLLTAIRVAAKTGAMRARVR
jgi:CubicO group peptidase (beta-lactamase class C family)